MTTIPQLKGARVPLARAQTGNGGLSRIGGAADDSSNLPVSIPSLDHWNCLSPCWVALMC